MIKSEKHRCVLSHGEAVQTEAGEVELVQMEESARAAAVDGGSTTSPLKKVEPNTERQHNEMLIHEHDLVPLIINEMNCIHCKSCGTNYCQLCGKSIG